MSEQTLYERMMAAAGEAARPAPRAPRASAAVVLWRPAAGEAEVEDGAGAGVEVYWVQRAEAQAFMGGWHAFPGGGVSSADLAVPVQGMPAGLDEGLSSADSFPDSLAEGFPEGTVLEPDLVPGLLACTVRELFEETGVLLVEELLPSHAEGPVASAAALETARRRLASGEARFSEVVTELGLTPDASDLVFAGRWLTPPFAPLRFDTRFFLLPWPRRAALQPSFDRHECADGEWVRPAEAVERWHSGEVIAAPPILHLLRVLAEDGPEAGLPRLLHPAEADLGPYRRIEFRPGVILLPVATRTLPPADRTNAYLLGTGERVLVDPGSDDPVEIDRLAAAARALEKGGEGRVSAIWLTHHHPDHVGGAAALRERLGVPIAAHAATAALLAFRGVAVDRELVDGELVVLAGDPPFPLRVVHTPGHAPGHLCFFDETWGSLVAGDMIAGLGTIVIDPPQGDMDAYLASLDKLLALEPKTLFPAHGPALRDAAGKLREYAEHRRWREEKVLAAWRDGLREPAAMLPDVYDDAPREAWPLAERQILAHLERLRRAGRLE
jgi:glyoxylase-like metal-dependent hydrolase (beta-lactamase superfamily II)/8-oxo-dGTP pyrophosphatase MutT (NUDIX family)